ncbi:hypothetical protein C8034_v001836 [Colletotrichum sidae]|uniref:Uncharacterized protein n=1 Tax=Colletotrichum sidae TaxID=1347389 RepID=A0A4R8SSD4_9PEZI|nr:hypothetical protein C8034_v001836 [Colletotrichum sidae]
MNIDLIKAINNHEDYSYLYKGLNKLALYEGDFAALPSPLKVAVAKFSLEITRFFFITNFVF